ncbi:MAG: FAD-binding oxidoreductase [Woeseiaceae bacterium]|nr:FAD-binding oxidoreductase [Woeseiaceae bacterium]
MLIDTLKDIVGPQGWKQDAADMEPFLSEWRGRARGEALLVVAPQSTEEVAAVVKACAEAGVGIVPQGGNTGLCGGALPSAGQVLLSMSRMNRVRQVDPNDYSITVEAGCILADVQNAAAAHARFFPLSLGAEGTCQIGGNLSTNAGGINVLRYGTARQQVLGLEVVLADGTVWDGLRTVRKDTAGYDLKQLFMGSEGTLGVITAAALRLWPQPAELTTMLAAVESPQHAVELLAQLRGKFGDTVQAFELISGLCLQLVDRHVPDASIRVDSAHPWYVLTDVETPGGAQRIEEAMMAEIESGRLLDVVVAKNAAEAGSFWRMRHALSEAQNPEGSALKHDISVPTGRIAEFVDKSAELVETMAPGARVVAFGHVGDGNLHYDVLQPRDADGTAFLQDGEALTTALYDLAVALGGSFSAEHGVGLYKRRHLERYRAGIEIELMKALKQTLDPHGVLNPGKVI